MPDHKPNPLRITRPLQNPPTAQHPASTLPEEQGKKDSSRTTSELSLAQRLCQVHPEKNFEHVAKFGGGKAVHRAVHSRNAGPS
jgi:hypothetical protein